MSFRPESMNESKVHYQEAWPPILHAAALWLNAEGFKNAEKEVQNISKGESFDAELVLQFSLYGSVRQNVVDSVLLQLKTCPKHPIKYLRHHLFVSCYFRKSSQYNLKRSPNPKISRGLE